MAKLLPMSPNAVNSYSLMSDIPEAVSRQSVKSLLYFPLGIPYPWPLILSTLVPSEHLSSPNKFQLIQFPSF